MPIQRTFNKKFFKIWSSDMAYILGFLFADGNIVKTKRNTHFVAFYNTDGKLLHEMRDCMQSTHAISIHKAKLGNVYRMARSRQLFEDVKVLGLIPHKAGRMNLPNIPQKYIGDFIRGYFDGDGCVWQGMTDKKRKKPSRAFVRFTSASQEFLKGLFLLFKIKGICGGSLFTSKNGKIYSIVFQYLGFFEIILNYLIMCSISFFYLEKRLYLNNS